MQGKITLVSPPDFYENSNTSILFAHITEEQQDRISQWFAKTEVIPNVNIYVYTGEPNVTWFLYALNRCEYKYMNLDGVNLISNWLAGYALARPNVFFSTSDQQVASIFSHINQHQIQDIEQFMEYWLSEQRQGNTTQL